MWHDWKKFRRGLWRGLTGSPLRLLVSMVIIGLLIGLAFLTGLVDRFVQSTLNLVQLLIVLTFLGFLLGGLASAIWPWRRPKKS